MASSDNPLTAERQASNVPVRELTFFLDGSESVTKDKERLMHMLSQEPFFNNRLPYETSFADLRTHTSAKQKRVVELINNSRDAAERRLLNQLVASLDSGLGTRLAVHYGLFIGAVQGQGTPELWQSCLDQGVLKQNPMRGCFAMTEIGHGSNVAGLLTTATLDTATDEFIINTPSLEATKWWIGAAATSATHAAVYARLIVNGQDHGVKTFLVQLRDMKTLQAMKGIKIGDCGHKFGRNNVDNGWIQFDHVRIPRTQMLQKHTKVAKDGIVTQPSLAQISYGPLILGRVSIINLSSETAKIAITTAIRYGVVRRQFADKPGALEKKIIDYATHQIRLMPLLAQTYAIHFVSSEMGLMYRELMVQLGTIKGNGSDHDRNVLEALKEMHATSSGLKATCTWSTLHLIEHCRQSLGGHGYSSHAGLASLYQDFSVNVTWEGDNTILTMQTARYLVQCFRSAEKGAKLPRGVNYLNKAITSYRGTAVTDLAVLSDALGAATAQLLARTVAAMDKARHAKQDSEAALQASAVELVRAHGLFYCFERFVDAIDRAPASLKPSLRLLCELFGVSSLKEQVATLLQSGYFEASQADAISHALPQLCAAVRKDAVSLVDAFNLSDLTINSPFGRSDGQVYKNYFDQVTLAHSKL